MPTILELGQKVKAKYPSYADMSDLEVGQKVKAKYPSEYGDFTDTPFSYYVPKQQETSAQKIAKYNQEQVGYNAENKKANSTGGFLGNFGKAVVSNIAPSEVGLGQTIAKTFGNQSDLYSGTINKTSGIQADLVKRIREKESRGEDTTRLKQAYNDLTKNIGGLQEGLNEEINLPSTSKVAGQLGGTALDLLTAGTYGKTASAMKTGTLSKAKVLPSVIPRKTEKFLSKATGKELLAGGSVGYGFDATQGLQNEEENPYVPGFGTLIGTGIPILGRGLPAAKSRFSQEGKVSSIISKRESELAKLDKNYASMRKASGFSDDGGLASRKRIASTDVLANAVDDNGHIQTRTPGGPIDQYKALTLDKTEGVVRNNLERLGEKTNLKEVEINLVKAINESGLEGADLRNALNNVRKEISGYRLKADVEGNIPLTLIHDAKISTTKGINYLTPPETKAYRKAIARGLKETVEKNTSFNTKEVNKELSKYLEDINFLERLDGKKVQGGKMGKYFSQLSGNIIGATVGNAVGGPIGSAIGSMAGGMAGQRIQGSILSKTLGGKTGVKIPKSKILEDAIDLGKSPRLQLPAPKPNQPKIQLFSGKTINLPKRSQSAIDASQSHNRGWMNTKYNPVNTTKANPPRNIIPKPIPRPKNTSKVELSPAKKKVPFFPTKNKQGGFISLKPYKGEKDLTTKILKDLEGKTTVSKQYILDATNRGELKQVERELIRNILAKEPATVNVPAFAKKVKAELLPVEITNYAENYENIVLPDKVRGKVKNYVEHIYESPIKTSAGNVHFRDRELDKYFGHTRIEDMADNKTRRVIEVQSDLYQKGRLDSELNEAQVKNAFNLPERQKRVNEVSKLQQYNDPTAHFRMVREEIKKAAQDGKTKLQFPTGETAMKIEGLGEAADIWKVPIGVLPDSPRGNNLTPDLLNDMAGKEIRRNQGESWIITDVLGDGKFKAVQKHMYEKMNKQFNNYDWNTSLHPESFDISGKVDTNNPIYKFYEKDVQKYLNKFGGKKVVDDKGVSWIEVPIKKEYGKQPIDAFGKTMLNPLFIGAGMGAAAVGASQLKERKKVPFLPKKKK